MNIKFEIARVSVQHFFDAIGEYLPIAIEQAAKDAFAKSYAEQKSIDWKCNGRVAHLAYYHKKARVRKKNLHRLERIANESRE